MSVSNDLVVQVRIRAGSRCEYCRMHQALQGATFHTEHVVPESRGGLTVLENLAFACPTCNLKKSDLITAIDPESGVHVSLFHPRLHDWNDHFEWHDYLLVGKSPIGRATLTLLDFNHPRRVLIRQAEEKFGLFPG